MPNGRFLQKTVWTLAALFLCSGQFSQGNLHADITPTQIELESFGWQPPPPVHAREVDSVYSSQKITIDHQGRVLVGFTVREPGDELRKRSEPALSFRVVRLTKSDTPDLSLALPTNNWLGNGLYLDHSDHIVARANDQLQLNLNDSEDTRQEKWKYLTSCGRVCDVVQSPTRRTLYIRRWDAGPPVTIVRTENPSDVKDCPSAPGYSPRSITDNFAYFNDNPGIPPMPPPIFYRWPLCDYANRSRLPITTLEPIYPFDDDSFFGFGSGDIVVYGADGVVKRKIRMISAKHEGCGNPLRMSEKGDRVVVACATQRGGSRMLDISSHLVAQRVVVYDVATGELLASIAVPPLSLFPQLAISPDGHRIAVLVKDTVTVADIP